MSRFEISDIRDLVEESCELVTGSKARAASPNVFSHACVCVQCSITVCTIVITGKCSSMELVIGDWNCSNVK